MKKIEEAAIAHSESRTFGVWKDEAKESFKAGVEFAQSWIDVNDELPERIEDWPYSDEVLTKTDKGHYWLEQFDYEENDWTCSFVNGKVTHWRPIEVK